MKLDELTPVYQRYILGEYKTEGHTKGTIVLEILEDGSAFITIGNFYCDSEGLNVHGLITIDLHKGKYKVPYFVYKSATKFVDADEALEAFSKWLEHRKENLGKD